MMGLWLFRVMGRERGLKSNTQRPGKVESASIANIDMLEVTQGVGQCIRGFTLDNGGGNLNRPPISNVATNS